GRVGAGGAGVFGRVDQRDLLPRHAALLERVAEAADPLAGDVVAQVLRGDPGDHAGRLLVAHRVGDDRDALVAEVGDVLADLAGGLALVDPDEHRAGLDRRPVVDNHRQATGADHVEGRVPVGYAVHAEAVDGGAAHRSYRRVLVARDGDEQERR